MCVHIYIYIYIYYLEVATPQRYGACLEPTPVDPGS